MSWAKAGWGVADAHKRRVDELEREVARLRAWGLDVAYDYHAYTKATAIPKGSGLHTGIFEQCSAPRCVLARAALAPGQGGGE